MRLLFSQKLSRTREVLKAKCRKLAAPHPAYCLFISVSDGKSRAHVVHGTGETFDAVWDESVSKLHAGMQKHNLEGRWLRFDWVEKAEPLSWRQFRTGLQRIKRNYFRKGLALDGDLKAAFLEQELNANAMLYGGNRIEHAVVNEQNFAIYAAQRFGKDLKLDFSEDATVYVLTTAGIFVNEDGAAFELDEDLNAGRRRIEQLSADGVLSLVKAGSEFLSRQVQDNGSFIYGYHPCFDRQIAAYNTLRHASTTYAMLEAFEVTRDEGLKNAIDRSISHLTGTLIKDATLPDGTGAAFLVEVNKEIKLGANAVALLALVKHCEITGNDTHKSLMERLALGIRHMQDQQTGSFVHVLHFPSLKLRQDFRTIYYEGEAAFGLMRLYNLTRDERWLETVEKAFGHFIEKEHWRHHDHWLSYCVNELTRYRPEERYFVFGIRNVADYLDFVGQRITTFPTLLELMMAAREMLSRLGEMPELRHLLDEIDLEKFEKSLEFRAHYLLNGFFWPEMAMYFRNPDRILGSFFIRHHAFRVRIDDVEHYLSGFIAYRNYLEKREDFRKLVAAQRAPSGWNAESLVAATDGIWQRPPPSGWTATGLCIHASTMQPGQFVVVRAEAKGKGVPASVIEAMRAPPAAIITEYPDENGFDGIPLLLVADTDKAILSIGHYARQKMTGKILAVTGSAGKTTTVAMLSHALCPWGSASKTAHNANLPHGVAWNLAAMPWDSPHLVLELAVGKMAQSARMAQPHIAIFTNVAPAHLGDHSTVKDIAVTKSGIFLGMSPGSIAVINRDMQEWEIVHDAATARGLVITHYGETEDSSFRLLDYDAAGQIVHASILGQPIKYKLGAAGKHMALNSLAVLAAIAALGHSLEPALAQLATFSAMSGRGEEKQLALNGKEFLLIDDAYNANPSSMKAALANLGARKNEGRKIVVLGEMAELGPDARRYHTELAPLIASNDIDRVNVIGDLYDEFWNEIPQSRRGVKAESLRALKPILQKEIARGDVLLAKGSNSTRIHELVSWMKKLAANQAERTVRNLNALQTKMKTPPKLPDGVTALLYDDGLKQTIFSAGLAENHLPASITKLLTLCLVEEKLAAEGLSTSDKALVSEAAAKVNSHWGFVPGTEASIETLMRATAIVSSNEAANALAEWHSGTIRRFTARLNARAAKLGLNSTHFSSPSGLGLDQRIDAQDALALAQHVFKHHPNVAKLCAEPEFQWNGKAQRNINRLLFELEGADGLKTGTIVGRGNHVIFSVRRAGHRWIAVVLGAASKDERDAAVKSLIEAYEAEKAAALVTPAARSA
ncbi:Mur ligase family protein [Mesorhizobium sp. SB112]|uniref:Mur ligase family protein n=1 Tax=Mesorhizobium sp. SB112 TaxID=3151853 RepID=UPI003265E5CD